jgi:hypothetical protein
MSSQSLVTGFPLTLASFSKLLKQVVELGLWVNQKWTCILIRDLPVDPAFEEIHLGLGRGEPSHGLLVVVEVNVPQFNVGEVGLSIVGNLQDVAKKAMREATIGARPTRPSPTKLTLKQYVTFVEKSSETLSTAAAEPQRLPPSLPM